MARQSVQRGFAQGILQGVKTGFGMGNMRTGFSGGFTDGTANMDKLQDPALLDGSKLPWLYANADNTVYTDANTTVILDRLKLPEKWNRYAGLATTNHPDYEPSAGSIDGVFSLTGKTYITDTANDWVALGSSISSAGRPFPRIGGQGLDNHVYLDMGGESGTATGTWFATNDGIGLAGDIQLNSIAPESITVMMVMKSKNTAGKTHFWIEDTLSRGGLYFTQPTTDTLELEFFSASGISSTYRSSNLQTELQDWILVTIKCSLKQKTGPGSEQEFYVNGKLQHQFVSSNWVVPEAGTSWTTSGQSCAVGVDSISSPNSNAMYFASLLILPYWANETEQIRLENYFRDYYGKRF